MLVLKLKRIGKKHQPAYRLVVTEKRSKLDGKFLEDLGWYDPRSKKYQIKSEKVLGWIGHGAQKSATVHNLLIRAGIIKGAKIPVHQESKTVDQSVNKNEQETNKKMDEQMNPTMPEEGVEEMVPETKENPEESPAVEPEAPASEEPVV